MYRYFAWLVLILILMAIINKFRKRPWSSGRVAVVVLLLLYVGEMVIAFMRIGPQQELMGQITADALIPVLIAGVLDRRFLNRKAAAEPETE
jgi:hypothetical protein